MKNIKLFLVLIVFLGLIFFFVDMLYITPINEEIITIEKEIIKKNNELLSAKIVSKNMKRVRKLISINTNIEIVGVLEKERKSQYTNFYSFLTTCINDLKIELMSIKPEENFKKGRVEKSPYILSIRCDFFKLGELISKFENSERILSIPELDIQSIERSSSEKKKLSPFGVHNLHVKMKIITNLIKKG